MEDAPADPPPEPDPTQPAPTQPDPVQPAPNAERAAARRRLEKAGWKLIVIAGASAVIPLAGAAFALFALLAGLSLRRRARAIPDSPAGGRATAAVLVALVACAWQAVLVATWWGGGV